MDAQSEFERDLAARVEKIESTLLELARKIDGLAAGRPQTESQRPASEARQVSPAAPKAASAPKFHRLAPEPSVQRGVDWWLARAGAALTVIAVILLYQYAVGHGWITPWVRVATGVVIGLGLLYWGQRMPPARLDDPSPVALRELMIGAALAVWYITAYAASARYHLVPLSASRYLFLVISVAGLELSLKERRSGLALIAIIAGFVGPQMLADISPGILEYAIYTFVLGAFAIVLYLMRGWQSVLWVSFVAVGVTFALPFFYSGSVLLTLAGVAVALAYGRAPILRRSLLATGSPRYTQPVRSRFTVNFLTDAGKFFRWFSPAAGALDSISVWIITLAAPLVGVALLSRAWPGVNDAVWGAIEIAIAAGAYRMCSAAADASSEVAHLEGVAALVWGTFGAIAVAQALVIPSFVEHGTMALGIVAIAAILAVTASEQPRFVAMVAAGTLMAGLAILVVLFNEAEFANLPSTPLHQDHLEVALTIAELLAVGAGVVAWLDMRRRNANANVANALILMCYAALMLVDARVLGEIWRPLVTASFAIAGTIMLFISRKGDNKVVRAVGAATLILVTFRLFFVDMQGVDTIWRVLLFLGVGALFLFTSRQLQAGRKTAVSEST